jgi:hypothetical protein
MEQNSGNLSGTGALIGMTLLGFQYMPWLGIITCFVALAMVFYPGAVRKTVAVLVIAVHFFVYIINPLIKMDEYAYSRPQETCAEEEHRSLGSLMKAVAARYGGKWYRRVTFSQTVEHYENGRQVKSEIWDEEYRFPARLTIYFTPGDTSSRYICRNDSVFEYSNGVLTEAGQRTHDAVILGMDIYSMPYPEIMKRWGDLTYDTCKFHTAVCDGRKYFVVGALEGDTLSSQVRFDAESLLFAGMRRQTPEGIREVRMLDYVQLPGNAGLINTAVEFRLNGNIYMREKYFNIKVCPPVKKQ